MLTMADNVPTTDPTAKRPLHPFFAQNRPHAHATDKPSVNNASPSSASLIAPPDTTAASDRSEDDVAEKPARGHSRRRKAEHELAGDESQKKGRPKKRTRHSTGEGIAAHFVKLGKSSESTADRSNNSNGVEQSVHAAATHKEELLPDTSNGESHDDHKRESLGNGTDVDPSSGDRRRNIDHASEPAPAPQTPDANVVKPRKLLHFDPKTGTIGSPPKPKASAVAGSETGGAKRTVPKQSKKPASKIARISYGSDMQSRTRIGELINAIISGQKPKPTNGDGGQCPSSSSPKDQPQGASHPTAVKASKTTHPFFSGLSKKTESNPQDHKLKKPNSSPVGSRMKQYSSTPCSPRKPRAVPAPRVPMPQFGVRNSGLRYPGARLPAWPWKDMVHVRGDEDERVGGDSRPLPLPPRKSKGNIVKILPGESVIDIATQSMGIQAIAEAVRNIDTDKIIPPPPELRPPQKHFESGSKLQSRILPQLKTFKPSSVPVKKSARSNGPAAGNGRDIQAPPQLARLFESVATSLSAFDMSQCETANWVQKYAPVNAAEVLQPGREAFLLRDWLQALMVQSVDTGLPDGGKTKAGSKGKGAGAGKKKRKKRLDGFIVSSDDEDYDLNELSDEGDDWAPSGSRGILRKTVVRSGDLSKGRDGHKTANTLVISGPHGCGKTAVVYAIAKELDFEVFEISPSSRRSGKDVLEKIGDMTKNHHVHQHQSAGKPDDHESAAEDEVAKDIKSGKQSTMKAFFRPKATGAKPKQSAKSAGPSPQNEAKKEPAKNQRQSLILLEEVDILYEEDKQFWTTVIGLIAQSKRPFIMTCNDETLVPLHTLRLHGIFRLSTPPRDLAVDRLILMAANEGHALTRESVEQLLDSRNGDLRAATMDLQYWCQIGVGDRRGGFDWFYPRWPKGVDLDENKEVVRVISQGTYQPGMNLLGRDSIVDPKLPARLVEEEILHQAWESWNFDMGHWQDSIGLEPWADEVTSSIDGRAERLRLLEAYSDFAETMSAADTYSCKSFAVFKEVSCLSSSAREYSPALIAVSTTSRKQSTAPSRSRPQEYGMTSSLGSHTSIPPLSSSSTR